MISPVRPVITAALKRVVSDNGFRIEVGQDASRHLTIRLFGELDLNGCDEFDAFLAIAQAGSGNELLLDLRGLTFIDSSGIRTLLAADKRARDSMGHIRIVPGPSNVRRVFELAGIANRLEFADGDSSAPTSANGSSGQ